MKTDKNSFEPILSIIKIVYMCGVLLYFMFLTRSALGQTADPVITLKPRVTAHPVNQKRIKVSQIYLSQIGVREKQPNSGTEVEKYLRYVNLPKGNPWCAAFVCWVYGQAGVENPRTGWSPGLFEGSKVIWERSEKGKEKLTMDSGQWTMGKKLKVGSSGRFASPPSLTTNNQQRTTPSTGDVFGIYFPEKGRIAHVGFVDEWKDPWVVTVEGNTNVIGSREGDGVYRKRRLTRSVYKVARYVR